MSLRDIGSILDKFRNAPLPEPPEQVLVVSLVVQWPFIIGLLPANAVPLMLGITKRGSTPVVNTAPMIASIFLLMSLMGSNLLFYKNIFIQYIL
jgi:hypothetical protein